MDRFPLTDGQAPIASMILRVGCITYTISSWLCIFRGISLRTLANVRRYSQASSVVQPTGSRFKSDRELNRDWSWKQRASREVNFIAEVRLRALKIQMLRERERSRAKKFVKEVSSPEGSFSMKVILIHLACASTFVANKKIVAFNFVPFCLVTHDRNVDWKIIVLITLHGVPLHLLNCYKYPSKSIGIASLLFYVDSHLNKVRNTYSVKYLIVIWVTRSWMYILQ